MIEADFLNPKEVIAHLKDLGYTDITSQHIKEFIQDLKKLIKYEQKHICQRCKNQCSHKSSSDESENSCTESIRSSSRLSCDESYANSVTSCSQTSYAGQSTREQDSTSGNRSKKNIPHKVPSSFIRPWNISSNKDSIKKKKTLDPVNLYHQYKESWSRQKIPGETSHSDLRWLIRNKMLGQEPKPRLIL